MGRRRLVLLQIRDQPEAEAQERACFLETCGLAVEELEAINVVAESELTWRRVDGADAISTFRYITLPLIRHMVFIGLLITSMISFRTLDVIFSMTGGGPSRSTYVLALYIIDQLWMRVNYGTGSAAGVIMLFFISSFSSFYIYLILKKR